MKKLLCCVLLACLCVANPITTMFKEGAEAVKKFGDDVFVFGAKTYKSIGVSDIEKKFLKSATSSKAFGKIVAKRNHIFRPTAENLEKMRNGRAPIGIDGHPVELHHIKQEKDGIIIELTKKEHRGDHYEALHKCQSGMKCTTDVEHGSEWNAFRQKYWRERAKEFDKAS